jgi:hypothetical protein
MGVVLVYGHVGEWFGAKGHVTSLIDSRSTTSTKMSLVYGGGVAPAAKRAGMASSTGLWELSIGIRLQGEGTSAR